MKLLIVTHNYMPNINARALRWSAISEYWVSKGIEVDIICGWNPGLALDEVIKGVRINRVGGEVIEKQKTILSTKLFSSIATKTKSFNKINDIGANAKTYSAYLLKVIRRLYDSTWKKIYWPDYACLWYFNALKKARQLCERERYDAIISVSLPFTGHLIGLWLKKRYYSIPWIVDTGDPFCFMDITAVNNHAFYSKLNYRIERKVFKEADQVSVTTPETALRYRKLFPESSHKISVTPPLLDHRFNRIEKKNQIFDDSKINLSYTGSFYKRIREPDTILFLFEHLFREKPNLKTILRLHFIGSVDGFRHSFEGSKELIGLYNLYGPQPREVVSKILEESDVLINLGNTTSYQLPSKVVEYAGSGKPILNICSSERDSSLQFLNGYDLSMNVIIKNGLLFCDIAKVASFIVRNAKKSLDKDALKEFIKPYQIEEISNQYLFLIRD
jgi:hypothetical protein